MIGECLRSILPPKEATQEDVAELLSEKNRQMNEAATPTKQRTQFRRLLSKTLFFRNPKQKP